MAVSPTGKLVIVSGPSGAGKSTVVSRLLEVCPLPLELSVSATTRSPRAGERDGIDYYFISHDEFARRRAEKLFLECKEVFGRGDWYGTPLDRVTTGLAAGRWIILEIDVEGARSVLGNHPDCITIFLHCGSLEELERRLRGRGTEDEAAVQRRLEVARRELDSLNLYRHVIMNDQPDRAVGEICEVLLGYQRAPEARSEHA